MKFVYICICMSLDYYSTNASILFMIRTKIDMGPDKTPIVYEQYWSKNYKPRTGLFKFIVVTIVTSL